MSLRRLFSTTRTQLALPPPPATPMRISRINVSSLNNEERNTARARASKVMAALNLQQRDSSPSAEGPEFTTQELNSMQLRFSQGDIYAPNDLTMEELKMRRSKRRNVKDVFDVLGVNPMTLYKNYKVLGEYVTSMGRITHSKETGLRPVNQRRMAKAIRRSVGIGFLPSTHRHPELIRDNEIHAGRRGGG